MFERIEESKAAPGQGRRDKWATTRGSGSLLPHYTRVFDGLQSLICRIVMRLALLLVNAGDALADVAMHLEIGA